MLPAEQVHAPHELIRNHGIVQRSQKQKQRAPPKPRPDERGHFIKIRRNSFRFQRVQRIATGVVMPFARLRANESFYFVSKGQQPKQIPLLFSSQPKHQRGSDISLQPRIPGHIPLLVGRRCRAAFARQPPST